jgi:polysaccharide export outer membrane protein
MKKRYLLCLIVGILFPLCVAAADDSGYLIGISDLLEISVWGEQNISRQVTVRNDGFISLPLVGEVQVAGKTPAQVKKDIETVLTKFIKDPRCAVIIIEPRSKRYYVQGQVMHPGQFTLDKDLYLTQVIPISGGFTDFADKDSIIIIRIEGDKKKRMKIDYDRILKGKDDDIMIRPGDNIIVP